MQMNIFSQNPALTRAVVLGSLWALALVGCGGGGGGSDSTAAVAPPTVAAPPVTVTSPTTPATTPSTGTENPAAGTGGTTSTPPSTSTNMPATPAAPPVTSDSTPTTTPAVPAVTAVVPITNITATASIAPGSISLFIGSILSSANIDGMGTSARFASGIEGIARDSLGNLYVADTQNCTLRKVSPDGMVTTLAGSPCVTSQSSAFGPDIVDGQGSAARFKAPSGVAVDKSGTVYVVDTDGYSSLIRRVSSTGVVTTLGGLGAYDGLPFLGDVRGIAVDDAYNLYVTSGVPIPYPPGGVGLIGYNSRAFVLGAGTTVRKISESPFGFRISILAGSETVQGTADGVGTEARFSDVKGIVADQLGNIYVSEPRMSVIRKITPAGIVSTFAGRVNSPGREDGQGSAARLGYIFDLAVDAANNVLVGEGHISVRRISPSGLVSTLGSTTAEPFKEPRGIAAGSVGDAYIVNGSEIQRIDANGATTTLAGQNPGSPTVAGGNPLCPGVSSGTGRTACPVEYLAVDGAGNTFVIVGGGLRKVTRDGVVTTVFSQTTSLAGLAVDSAGNIYVGQPIPVPSCQLLLCAGPSYKGGSILKVSPTGVVTTIWSSAVISPLRISIDAGGNLYVGEPDVAPSGMPNLIDSTIVKLSPTGAVISRFSGLQYNPSDGNRTIRHFAVDRSGNLIVAQRGTVRKYNGSGSLVAVYKSNEYDVSDTLDGLAVDAAGNIYLANAGRSVVSKLAINGTLSAVAGVYGVGGIEMGTLPGKVHRPSALAFDSDGTLYIGSGDAILKVKFQ
jgi:sugar lactone lactonase YvrE